MLASGSQWVLNDRGAVVLIGPDVGHEQQGVRPCVVLSGPEVVSNQKYPMLCVVPVSSTPAEGALYPRLSAGESGLRNTSYALIDQLRSVDKRRVRKLYGNISPLELQALEDGLRLFLSL